MLVAALTGLPGLLETLDVAERPSGGMQVMAAAAPFEPNPIVPTVVYGLDALGAWEPLVGTLRLALPPRHPVWLLRAGGSPTPETLDRLDGRPSDAEALFLPALEPEAAERSLQGLRYLVHRLRAPGGCPWDREQTHESLIRYVLEEAYEVADAIRHEGSAALAEELGDLLLQVFLQAELAEEAGEFTLNDVVERISAKLIRRHPHVFGDVVVAGAGEVEWNWEQLKGAEKGDRTSVLDGLPRSLPALMAAQEIQRRLKKVGFDWPDREGVVAKLAEELSELRDARSPDEAVAELGDVLFILTRLGLDLGADAEEALRATNGRVGARFRHVEAELREQGRTFKDLPLEELLARWDGAKRAEGA
jgi:tetrapyrrole methylase family protein / MazG family protein